MKRAIKRKQSPFWIFFFFFEKEKYNKKKGIKDSGVKIKETRIKTENIDSNKTIYSLIYFRKRHKNYEKREERKKKSNQIKRHKTMRRENKVKVKSGVSLRL